MSIVNPSRSRPNDFYYDPSNVSAGAKDYYKQAWSAKLSTAKFAVCPIFPSMFSDLQNYPCKQYVIRRSAPIPAYQDVRGISTSNMSRGKLLGQDRYKYFHNSVAPAPAPVAKQVVPELDLKCFYEIDRIKKQEEQRKLLQKTIAHSVKVQTIFRETSAQTSPWQPDYTVIEGDPELLMLDFLKWGEGLPAGMAEVEYIDRMRNKKKWESSFPEGHTEADFRLKRDMIEQQNRIEWANRERDIDAINALRLELLERMLNEVHVKSKCRNEQKMRMFVDMKLAEKQEKIAKVRQEAERQKRRLQLQFNGVLVKYGTMDVFEEHSNYHSELYCPLRRNGTNPRYRHEKLTKTLTHFKPQYCKVEKYNALPRHLADRSKIGQIKLDGTRLCIKETKWTLPVLKALYEELKELREEKHQHPNLRVCIQDEGANITTPEISECDECELSEIHIAAKFLQKVLRGRATQNRIFIGRERCHELIDELRGNYALLKGDVCKKARIREKRKEEQLNSSRCTTNMKALEGSLRKLSGSVTGTLLDFLSKDLQRLLRERRAHAMILLVERLRQIREAEEAGRRQKEIRRRKEHDEMFKQMVKVHQDTVDVYLQDIITEGMQFASEEKAQEYVHKMAAKVEEEQKEMEENAKQFEREEYIAAMVHNFVIPEVEKSIVREKMTKNRRIHLRNAHDLIYNKIESLPKPKASVPSTVSETTTASSQQKVVDEEVIRRSQEMERQTVVEDVRAILDELVAYPYKESALKDLVPCGKEEPEEESSSTESVAEEAAEELQVEFETDEDEDEEKFQGVDDSQADVIEIRLSDEEDGKDVEGFSEEEGEDL